MMSRILFTIAYLLSALNSQCSAFTATPNAAITWRRSWSVVSHRQRLLDPSLRSSASDPDESDQQPQPSSAASSSPVPQPRVARRSMDPLIASLTRMDEETINAKRMQIPIWGELILDKSLIVLIPAAFFAVIGFAMSIYVILNSQDAIVDALADASSPAYLKGVSEGTNVDPNACRGLCGSQQDDLEALRGIMNGITGSK